MDNDTVRLLRECDAGIKMGIDSLGEVLDSANADSLRCLLYSSRERHEEYAREIQDMLKSCCDDGKSPGPVAKGMAWARTNLSLALDGSDAKIAELVSEGCGMGIRSLSRYINQYQAASDRAVDMARKLIGLEEELERELRAYL